MIYDDDVSWNASASPPKDSALHNKTQREELQDVLPPRATPYPHPRLRQLYIFGHKEFRFRQLNRWNALALLDFELDSLEFTNLDLTSAPGWESIENFLPKIAF